MRKKLYMLCRRINGEVYALFDESFCSVNWSNSYGIIWNKPPLHYLNHFTKPDNGFKHVPDAFIVRINSKGCPINVELGNETCHRYNKGNRIFHQKNINI